MRALVFLCVLATPLAARAEEDVSRCTDAYADCHETCSLRFGMVTRDSERIKLSKCLDKCKRSERDCRDQYFETKNNGLDEGALKKKERDDDLREDNRKSAIVPADEKPRPKPKEEEPKRTSTRADELGNKDKEKKAEATSSSEDPRTNLKFEEPKKEEPKKKEEAPKQASLDNDVRKEESEPAPKAEKKRSSSSSEEPPKKKKERALDEWDPEAL